MMLVEAKNPRIGDPSLKNRRRNPPQLDRSIRIEMYNKKKKRKKSRMPIIENREARSRGKVRAARKLMGPRVVTSYQEIQKKTVVISMAELGSTRILPICLDALLCRGVRPGVH